MVRAMGLGISKRLIEAAIHWAETTASEGLRQGRGLTEPEMKTARDMGVTSPELIRLVVGPVPMPTDGLLKAAMEGLGIGEEIEGLTLGYAIYLRQEPTGSRDIFLAHEFRHCYQFTQTDGLASFAADYFDQLVKWGYENPLEIDAREASEKNLQKIYESLKKRGTPSVIAMQVRGSR